MIKVIYLVLSKAFDPVGYKMLIQKLEHYRINGKYMSWFKNMVLKAIYSI